MRSYTIEKPPCENSRREVFTLQTAAKDLAVQSCLGVIQICVDTVQSHQRIVGALLLNLSVSNYQNTGGVSDGG